MSFENIITGKFFHAIEQVHGSVVHAVMRRLQKGVEPVEKLVTDSREQNIIFLVMCGDILFQIPQHPMIFVCCQLNNPHTDLSLPFLAVFFQLYKEHY